MYIPLEAIYLLIQEARLRGEKLMNCQLESNLQLFKQFYYGKPTFSQYYVNYMHVTCMLCKLYDVTQVLENARNDRVKPVGYLDISDGPENWLQTQIHVPACVHCT